MPDRKVNGCAACARHQKGRVRNPAETFLVGNDGTMCSVWAYDLRVHLRQKNLRLVQAA